MEQRKTSYIVNGDYYNQETYPKEDFYNLIKLMYDKNYGEKIGNTVVYRLINKRFPKEDDSYVFSNELIEFTDKLMAIYTATYMAYGSNIPLDSTLDVRKISKLLNNENNLKSSTFSIDLADLEYDVNFLIGEVKPIRDWYGIILKSRDNVNEWERNQLEKNKGGK